MEENKEKRVLSIELGNDVKRVSITGKNGEEQVVMRQELSEDDLEATGGFVGNYYIPFSDFSDLSECGKFSCSAVARL